MLKNALLIRYAGGWTELEDSSSIDTWGRREDLRTYGDAQSEDEAKRNARAELDILAQPLWSTTAGIQPTGTGDEPYADFGPGDWRTFPDETDTPDAMKVASIAGRGTPQGGVDWAITLRSRKDERERQVQRWVRRMSNGTGGGASQSSTPARPFSAGGGGGTSSLQTGNHKTCINVADLGCKADGIFDNWQILQDLFDSLSNEPPADVVKLCFPAIPGTNNNGYNHYLISQTLYCPFVLELAGIAHETAYNGVALVTPGNEDLLYGSQITAYGMGFIAGFDVDGSELGSGTGTLIQAHNTSRFVNCYFEGSGVGIHSYFRLSCFGCGFYGLTTCITNTSWAAHKIIGNDFGNCAAGISISESGLSNLAMHVMIEGNSFFNIDDGIAIDTGTETLVAITGNTIDGGSRGAGVGIDVRAQHAAVSGNSLKSDSFATDGIQIGGDHARVQGNTVRGYRYGASILAGATNAAVEHNTLSGNTGTVSDAGAGSIINNNQA